MRKLQTILAIGAHPDDIELGCGGSIAKFAECGTHVRALVLSNGAVGNRHNTDRLQETTEALALLGVTDVHTEDFPDTKMYNHLTEIITFIEGHSNAIKPDRVYTMFERDKHQDHRTAFEASVVACRPAGQIICYETPSSWTNFTPQVFEGFDERVLDKKIAALALHTSQCDRPYTQPNVMRDLAHFRGQLVGIGPAEAFIAYKLVL
ncbi:MAG: PIG-L family deacetylase [Candidatus Pacebacteria bacterium]|nr:PIG-L family deacetylase [Candidatus Paceibacterota bacterium]